MRKAPWIVVVAVVACGGQGAGTPAAGDSATAAPPPQSPSIGPAKVDSAALRDSLSRAAKAAVAKRTDKRLRDSATGPKFGIDEKGKVTPIKRP